MVVDTIAGLKARMPANTPGGTTIPDLHDEFRPTTTTTWLQYQRTASGTTVVSSIFVQETV
jgi:hypothetical protein